MKSFRKSFLSIFFLLTTSLFIVSCGGGGDDGGGGNTPAVQQGRFVDAAVIGISYETSSGHTGLTDNSGAFSFATGDTVRFFIGDIEIGVADAAAVVTPVSFVADATDEQDPTVTNIVRLLLSCDTDLNIPGIQISEQLRTDATGSNINLDFTLSAAAFAVSPAVVQTIAITNNMLPDVTTAQTHLKTTLLSEISGNYMGTFSGQDSGTFNVNIDTTGNVTGSGFSNAGGGFTVSGTVTSNGQATVTGFAGLATFSGTISIANGTFAGNWVNDTDMQSGSFTGRK